MYLVLVSPLSHVLSHPEEDPNLGVEFVKAVQQSISAEVGTQVSWDEDGLDLEENLEADDLNPYCWHGLRVSALRLELEGSLEGFDPGDEPWDHALIALAEKAGGSARFPQLVHGEAELVAYAPVELEDCYRLVPVAEPLDPKSPEAEHEPGDSGEGDVAVGSLPGLRRELAELGEALGLPATPEITDELLEGEEDDPLAEARLGCAVLAVRAAEAAERDLPLIITWDESSDDDDEEAE